MKPVSKIDQFVIKKVQERRIQMGYSQAALSYELDVSASYIGQVESNHYKARYSIERLNQLAKILKCSPKDFFPEKPI